MSPENSPEPWEPSVEPQCRYCYSPTGQKRKI